MKKKRFYSNKKRNTKWTEPVKGRKIDFADKYIEAGTGSDKFDSKRPKKRKKYFTPEKTRKILKNAIITICCFLIINVGYAFMDLYMERNSMPDEQTADAGEVTISSLNIEVRAMTAQPLSLDGGVMLEAVINHAHELGYTGVCFDLKRDDGTIGYNSSLATIDAYGAITSASADLESSVSMLTQSDLLPVARISCYKDNIASRADITAAVVNGTSVYRDDDGNAYLNPDSSITYNYIKGIIEETHGMGISVYVLDNTTLPENAPGEYNDGFEAIERKLYADFGDEIKLLCANNIEATVEETAQLPTSHENTGENTDEYNNEDYSENEEDITEETLQEETPDAQTEEDVHSEIENILSQSIKGASATDNVWRISTNREQEVRQYLDDRGITNYVITAS